MITIASLIHLGIFQAIFQKLIVPLYLKLQKTSAEAHRGDFENNFFKKKSTVYFVCTTFRAKFKENLQRGSRVIWISLFLGQFGS